ncbi:phage minor tail protein G, partial [Shigella flexneri]|uniref:phage tail assembly chaperone G n=1 Tax=Shigella flexneri TaxID=623 RepID=UPI000E5D3382
MFLKQDTFNYEKQSVVLSELSGLQRIEYLTFVQQRTAKFDAQEGELPEAERLNRPGFPGECFICEPRLP